MVDPDFEAIITRAEPRSLGVALMICFGSVESKIDKFL
jgi:hypothetical protein